MSFEPKETARVAFIEEAVSTRNPFSENDIVVVKRSAALAQWADSYDFSKWALVRLRVTEVDPNDGYMTVQAIDERPDLDWICRGKPEARVQCQQAHMSWPWTFLEFYS